MSISATCSITSRSIALRARSCSMSKSIKDARKFMSAARAAARVKPVVVVKGGRQAAGAKAAATHTGRTGGSDAVYAAAFHRAGVLRVLDLGELFDAAETLARVRYLNGNRLAILTNGGGIGVLAADRLTDFNGSLADLSASTRAELDRVLPPTWSKSNPVDIIGDADEARYTAALEALLAAPEVDATLVINVQTSDCTRGCNCSSRGRSGARAARAQAAAKASFRSMGRRRSEHFRNFRQRRHPAFRDRNRCRARLHADRPASRGDRRIDADAPEPAERDQARQSGGARGGRKGVRRRPPAGSTPSKQ